MAGTPRIRIVAGDRFGRWTIVSQATSTPKFRRWTVRCECGNEKTLGQRNLTTGASRSCGCLNREVKRDQLVARTRTHGLSSTPEFRIWTGMLNRCFNPNEPAFPRYGGRGIAVCDEWRKDFTAFLRDMGPRPSSGHSLDRIKNHEGYAPGNVRWATRTVQNRNRGNARFVTAFGETKLLGDWARERGIKRLTLHARIFHQGWDPERALSTPTGKG